MPRAASVLIGPAEIAFTRIFLSPRLIAKVAYSSFERGLGYTHHVVVGEDLIGAVVGQRKDAAAFAHERHSGASDGDQRVDADVMRDAEILALGEEEVVLDGVCRGEADGVDDGVDHREGCGDFGEGGVDLLVGRDVELDGAGATGLAEGFYKFLCLFFQSFRLVAEDESVAGGG